MKKAFFLLVIAIITFFGCKYPLKFHSGDVASGFVAADSIPHAVAIDMINHYLDTVLVDHSLHDINKQASLYRSDLDKIFKLSDITRIKLLAAAYLDTDSIVARRNKVTVLVQLKQGNNSNYFYYDIQSFGPERLCPPPYGCSPMIEN